MARQHIDHTSQFMAQKDQPLIGIIFWENEQEVVHYFSEDAAADAALTRSTLHEVLKLAGSWSDLSWDIVEEELYRIRHESHPTPPLTL
jgi:hypothetical protein